jgi:hypothetical protein
MPAKMASIRSVGSALANGQFEKLQVGISTGTVSVL